MLENIYNKNIKNPTFRMHIYVDDNHSVRKVGNRFCVAVGNAHFIFLYVNLQRMVLIIQNHEVVK